MLFMVIENFTGAAFIYRRFPDKGRLAPAGLNYVAGWVDEKFEKCFQLMEAENENLIEE